MLCAGEVQRTHRLQELLPVRTPLLQRGDEERRGPASSTRSRGRRRAAWARAPARGRRPAAGRPGCAARRRSGPPRGRAGASSPARSPRAPRRAGRSGWRRGGGCGAERGTAAAPRSKASSMGSTSGEWKAWETASGWQRTPSEAKRSAHRLHVGGAPGDHRLTGGVHRGDGHLGAVRRAARRRPAASGAATAAMAPPGGKRLHEPAAQAPPAGARPRGRAPPPRGRRRTRPREWPMTAAGVTPQRAPQLRQRDLHGEEGGLGVGGLVEERRWLGLGEEHLQERSLEVGRRGPPRTGRALRGTRAGVVQPARHAGVLGALAGEEEGDAQRVAPLDTRGADAGRCAPPRGEGGEPRARSSPASAPSRRRAAGSARGRCRP